MVIQGLGRRLLSGRPPCRRVPQLLLEILQLRRDRLEFLQDSLSLHDRAMEEKDTRGIPLLTKDSQEDHPRQQAAKLRGQPSVLLRHSQQVRREARTDRSPTPSLDQAGDASEGSGEFCLLTRLEVQARRSVQAQVLVQPRSLQAARKEQRRDGVVAQPVPRDTRPVDGELRLPKDG